MAGAEQVGGAQNEQTTICSSCKPSHRWHKTYQNFLLLPETLQLATGQLLHPGINQRLI